jgi:hypothetical protein
MRTFHGGLRDPKRQKNGALGFQASMSIGAES